MRKGIELFRGNPNRGLYKSRSLLHPAHPLIAILCSSPYPVKKMYQGFPTSRFLAFACILSSALAENRKYELKLTNEFIQPDGFNRSAVLSNRQFPAPLISLHKHDQLQVNVVNRLTDISMAQGTSIHWHGLFQHKAASQDGVAWVTQCPISPGEDFQYNFNVGEQTGTYWYHSHIATQYCDGLRLHLPSPLGFQAFENPQSTVINGLGRLPHGPKSPLAVVGVNFGLRYRFRAINTACISSFNFSIDHHKLIVIEADGVETHPVEADVVSIFPGQRLSVVVQANQKIDNYWIRAVPDFVGILPNNETGVDAAILRYRGSKLVEPRTVQENTRLLREQDLVPLISANLGSRTPDVSITLNIGADFEHNLFLINDKVYTPPPIPVLLQIMNGSVEPFSIMPTGSVIVLPRNKLIAVTVPGGSVFAPHAFHLHGHAFEVIRSADSTTMNTKNPPIRDVASSAHGMIFGSEGVVVPHRDSD
ncbi:multicopper oxidase-domain-containing protein [Collybia nuda]|uniref:laccase n=1 Tax=Collybia nuda TaxID=64659 RepID=A0A9P6CDY0_9AGAR|nr:multicopper oxidase-domain-containing protein [Collybia nuda]